MIEEMEYAKSFAESSLDFEGNVDEYRMKLKEFLIGLIEFQPLNGDKDQEAFDDIIGFVDDAETLDHLKSISASIIEDIILDHLFWELQNV